MVNTMDELECKYEDLKQEYLNVLEKHNTCESKIKETKRLISIVEESELTNDEQVSILNNVLKVLKTK